METNGERGDYCALRLFAFERPLECDTVDSRRRKRPSSALYSPSATLYKILHYNIIVPVCECDYKETISILFTTTRRATEHIARSQQSYRDSHVADEMDEIQNSIFRFIIISIHLFFFCQSIDATPFTMSIVSVSFLFICRLAMDK